MTEHTPNETEARHANKMRGCRVGELTSAMIDADEQRDRILAMTEDNNRKWDHSYRDKLALRWALSIIDAAEKTTCAFVLMQMLSDPTNDCELTHSLNALRIALDTPMVEV